MALGSIEVRLRAPLQATVREGTQKLEIEISELRIIDGEVWGLCREIEVETVTKRNNS